ncbi:chlorophyll synthesis pathway protein BchC [Variovorax sp. J22R133]|uniref:chlorophyll synthesis pathway protein BchC n=1 Tax=Variovorax brevis TaxID=3053503 RepID=UPI002576EB6D|nr:chlorophyll synthesis pathway protein BchC [Variovorax sp. J22R133]MDM0113792.1 chlorophyll synthesis pathway protein BchC [Variovorax sp. J22R133]
MNTLAVVFEKPQQLALSELALIEPGDEDVVVDIEWSGISTGTERLLWNGRMPQFPGMGYPLVPGYESVGHVTSAGKDSGARAGDRVFVPGAKCFGEVRGLFGGAASTVVLPGARTLAFDAGFGEQGVLLALAATAHHVSAAACGQQPDLIVGHGVLGRMVARIAVSAGASPVVWETNARRREGALGYEVIDPSGDSRRDYRSICDVSGDASLLDTLIARLAPGGEIVLAGFYDEPLSFNFPPAFMREARLRIAAQWQPQDLVAVKALVESGRLPLDGLITHRADATEADSAYRMAFGDPACLKMVLDWRSCK